MFSIPDFTLFRRDRPKRKGGGVCVYVKSAFQCDILPFSGIESTVFEFIWLRITVSTNNSFILCALYHPPNSSFTLYQAGDLVIKINSILDHCTATFPDDYFVLTGDLNSLNMTDVVTEHGLDQLVTKPTHGHKILDKFFTNRPDLFKGVTLLPSSIKTNPKALLVQPEALHADNSQQQPNSPPRVCYFYDTREQFMKNLASELLHYNWSDHPIITDGEIDIMYNSFLLKCKNLILKHIPKRKVTLGRNDPYFVSPLVKKLLRKRNKLCHRGKVAEAAALSVKINELVAENKQKLMEKASNGDTKTLWKAISTTSNTKKSQYNLLADFDSVDTINEHFTAIATDPDYDITSPIIFDHTTFVPSHEGDKIPELHEYEVFKALDAITKTSSGPDNIPFWFFKKFSPSLAPVVQNIFNRIIRTATIPTNWRHAVVTPIPKVPQVRELTDLRPISVTSLLSRVFERIVVRKYIMPKLPQDLLIDQFAFKPTGSTTAALVSINHHITSMLETNQYVHCICIDFSKAFDTVNHSILLSKLGKLPIHPAITALVSSFLFNRAQSTRIGSVISKPLRITRSIVQGSGLGPTLYIINASDLKPLAPINKIPLYADDSTLLVPETSPVSVKSELDNIKSWAADNKLIINIQKTKQLIFRRPNLSSSYTPLLIPELEEVDTIKLLGVYVNSTFNLNEHVNLILTICSQRFYLLKVLRQSGLSLRRLDWIFTALVVSRVSYAIEAWGGFVSKLATSKINKMFKKARRWGLCTKLYSFEEINDDACDRLCLKACKFHNHCLSFSSAWSKKFRATSAREIIISKFHS